MNMGFIDYLKSSLTAQLGIIAICALWIIDPHQWEYTYGFIQFCILVYCLICALELFILPIKDKILAFAYIIAGAWYQPFYEVISFWSTVGRTHNFMQGSEAYAIRLGFVFLALIVITYLEKRYRMK